MAAIDPNATTIETYDQIAVEYAQKNLEYLDPTELDRFISYLPKSGSILDVGCGNGRDANYLQANGFTVIATDLSRQLLKEAKKLYPGLQTQQMDMRRLSFDESTFDGVLANASLLHLEKQDVPLTLSGFNRVLKQDGMCLIIVKQGKGDMFVVEEKSSNMPRYFIYFQPDEIRELMEQAGFEILESYTYNGRQRRTNSRDIDWLVTFGRKT